MSETEYQLKGIRGFLWLSFDPLPEEPPPDSQGACPARRSFQSQQREDFAVVVSA